MDPVVVLETALAAVLFEARKLNIDVNRICDAAKNGLFDGSKPYRWASASVVVPAQNAIDSALDAINR